jgi:hypothetical protein
MQAAIIQGSVPNFFGYGYGDGDGDGYGDGYGYSSGSGYGDGDGYGDGYGDGSGSGSGDGDGDGEYWAGTVSFFAKKMPDAAKARLTQLQKAGAKIAFWRSGTDGQPSNSGGKIEAAAPGVIHTSPGPLKICEKGTLHATLIPPKWKGERWWIVALHGEVVGDDEKYGCLKREIIGECV